MSINDNLNECLKATMKGFKSFDLVYYMTGMILHHYSRHEIRENATNIATCLAWLEALTDEPCDESSQFYYEQVMDLKNYFKQLMNS